MKFQLILRTFFLVSLFGCDTTQTIDTESESLQNQSTPTMENSLTETDLLMPDLDCEFPCFGGLYPRESNVEDVEEFLAQFNIDGVRVQLNEYDMEGYGIVFFQDDIGMFNIDLLLEDDELSRIIVGISNSQEWLTETPYDLPDIFNIYGEPDDIFVSVSGLPTGFSLVMPFSQHGFMLRYLAYYDENQLPMNDNPLPVCLHAEIVDLQQIDIWLWNVNDGILAEEIQPDLYQANQSRPWWRIQSIADASVTEFVEFVVSNPQECFLLPSLPTLRVEGYTP